MICWNELVPDFYLIRNLLPMIYENNYCQAALTKKIIFSIAKLIGWTQPLHKKLFLLTFGQERIADAFAIYRRGP